MAGLGKFKGEGDPDLIEGLVDSGSIGKGFHDLANENTGSLGLKTPAAKISSSLNDMLNEDEIESPLQTSLQYITAKVFETRDNSAISFHSGSQAFVIANTNKTHIGTAETNITNLQAASASFAANVKRDTKFIYFPVIANFSGNIGSAQFIPLSDGETETTNNLQRRNNFIAPTAGTLHKVFVRSNASLLSGKVGVTLTGTLTKYPNGTDAKPVTGTATVTTAATSITNTLDFSSVSNNSFSAGDRLLVSLQADLDATKNYYVTAVFKLDQSGLD